MLSKNSKIRIIGDQLAELIWEGKYKDGKKIAPVRIALPFQTIETANESSKERVQSLDIFSNGTDSNWKNRLIWGDKKRNKGARPIDYS